MENSSLIFSIEFFLTFILYCIFGGYTLYIDPKSALNRVFAGVCISLGIWSLGFCLQISAPDIQTSIAWSRIAALGWGSMYSLLLHFVLLLTDKREILKKWWIYILIYLPGVVTVYVFGISNHFTVLEYNMAYTYFGWINMAADTGWDWFFNFYSAIYFGIGVVLVWVWGRKSRDVRIKKQAKLIFYSFIIAVIIGILTDKVLGLYITIPQIAPVIIVLPVSIFYYSIRRYGLMQPQQINHDEIILTEAGRVQAYRYISFSFLAGGVMYIAAQYLAGYSISVLWSGAGFVAFLFIISLFIQIVQRLKIKQDIKDLINIITIAVIIPIITLRFIEYASVTIWAFPMIVIIFSLVFNKRFILVILTSSILITQVIVWMLAPNLTVNINAVDYIERLGILGISLWLAFYVNKLYILRLKENADQVKLQKLISDISSEFAALNKSNLEQKINSALGKCGLFFKTDRVFVMHFNSELNTMTCRHKWCRDGSVPETGAYETPMDAYVWLKNLSQINDRIEISNVQKLPQEAAKEKEELLKRGIRSMILIPIISNNNTLGLLGFGSNTAIKKWREDHILLVKVMANILADALTRIEAEEEIAKMAYYDHLTKLPNRLMFKDRVDQAIFLARRTARFIGIIFLDLDSFKNINDTMGHEGGDELIKNVAQVLKQNLRKLDTVSRFGGDEFLIMLNNIARGEDISKIADHIMDQFKKPFIINNQEYFITASAGITVFPVDGEDTETLIKNADIAMYKAKAKGKNQYVMCTSQMKEEVQKKMKLTNSLYRALERQELFLQYQPQISLKTGKITGLEALLRWNHPELGMISPNAFVPISEQTGLINSIGEWVLRTACRQNKEWQEKGLSKVRMAVNISVNQFRNPNLVHQVSDILNETGLEPQYLELEITESIAINESKYIISVLSNLKKLGISISIDDFGTEYSSLSTLKLLPIDRIKMDMQFISGIESNEKDQAITKLIINLAKSLGLNVIAEGVETKEQMEFLRQKMCDEAQGFYYFKPMDARDVEKIMTS